MGGLVDARCQCRASLGFCASRGRASCQCRDGDVLVEVCDISGPC